MQIGTKIGIDPGITGAIAIVSDDCIQLFDMPVLIHPWKKPKKNKAGKLIYPKLVDGFALMGLLLKYAGLSSVRVNIELVQSMTKQGVTSSFNFGQSFGIAIGVVQAMGFTMDMVRPQKWKAQCGLIGMDKDASRVLAIQMYPHLAEDLKLKKHNGRSDALFIAIS